MNVCIFKLLLFYLSVQFNCSGHVQLFATPWTVWQASLSITNIRVFSNESVLCIKWPKYWSFTFSISPSNEYSRLISFRIDLFDLLAVQGALKSFLQHYNSKGSILQCSAFFMVQLSHLYMTEKTMALT